MVEKSDPGKEPPQPEDGPLARWTKGLTDFQRLLAALAAVLAAFAVVIGAAIGIVDQIGGKTTTSQSTSTRPSLGPDGSPSSGASTISPPMLSPTAMASTSSALNISVTCALPGQPHEGQTTTATYTITSNQSVKVGIGAGVYDSQGNDQSNGDGDIDAYQLVAGTQTVTRDLVLPSSLAAGRYEIDAEIWPANEIGADGVDTLADAVCGSFNAP